MIADTETADHKTISLPSSTPRELKSTSPESKEVIFKSINVPSLSISITEAQACVIGDFIFIVGGGNGTTYSNRLIRFNPKFNTFEMMADIKTPVYAHAVAAKDNQIFVFGGFPQTHKSWEPRISDQNQCYDMKTNTWSSKTPLSGVRVGLSATTIGDKIYVAGGSDMTTIKASEIVEIYDIKTNSWEKIADMPGPRRYHKSVNIGNKLYIFDGETDIRGSTDQRAFVYDIPSKKWEQYLSLTEALLVINQPIFRQEDFNVLVLGDGRVLPLSVWKPGTVAAPWQHQIFCFGKTIEYTNTILPTGSNEVSSYLLLDKDLLAQGRTALPEWSGIYRSNSSQELIINEKGLVKFHDHHLFGVIFDVRTKTLYADNIGDTKDSFQSTFYMNESSIRSCEGPSFTGKREGSIPVSVPPSRFSTESTPTSPTSRPPGNFLLKFVTSDVVRAGYDGRVKVKLKMEYKITDEKGKTQTITTFTKETQLGMTSFERNKTYSFFMWFEDNLPPSLVKKVEARTPKALTIAPESNFWGDQWHVDEIAVLDLTYNIMRLCRLSSKYSASGFSKVMGLLCLIAIAIIYRRAPNPGNGYRPLPIHEESVVRESSSSSSDYIPKNNYLLVNSENEYPLSDDFKQLEPESIKNISSGLSVVYLWSFLGKFESWGHAALGLSDGTYISWWPQGGDYDLYLMSEFDIGQCNEIKEIKASDDNAANIVILTNQNTSYFIFKNQFVMNDDKPQVVEGINRQGISPSVSIKPIKYTDSREKEVKIVNESLLKGGHSRVPVLPEFINSLVPDLQGLYRVSAMPNQTYDDDVKLEGGGIYPKHADITITIPDLNVAAIKVWWESFKNNPTNKWETLGQNCAKTVFDALKIGLDLPIESFMLPEDWNRLHKISQLIYTPEYIMYLAYQIANYKFNNRNSLGFEISENKMSGHVLSFMAMPRRSVPNYKARSTPENKYDSEEQTRFNFSPSREKDHHQEATSTIVSDSFKLSLSVKLRYAMWGLPPPELIVKAPVQNETVLGN